MNRFMILYRGFTIGSLGGIILAVFVVKNIQFLSKKEQFATFGTCIIHGGISGLLLTLPIFIISSIVKELDCNMRKVLT